MDRRAIRCFEQALQDMDLEDARLPSCLADYFAWATTVHMAAYPHSPGDVPPDLRIPRWSWNGLVR